MKKAYVAPEVFEKEIQVVPVLDASPVGQDVEISVAESLFQ